MERMFFENKSRFGFHETVQRFSDAATNGGWKVTYTHDLQETMRKNGFDVAAASVVELCKPKYAHTILSDDTLRIYSNMMPCRISMYEKSDGQTYISRMNVSAFAVQIGGVVAETMAAAYAEVERFVADLTE